MLMWIKFKPRVGGGGILDILKNAKKATKNAALHRRGSAKILQACEIAAKVCVVSTLGRRSVCSACCV